MKDLEGKLAVVFGGGRDIGLAAVHALADAGADVMFSYNSTNPQAFLDTLNGAEDRIRAFKVDALDTNAVRGFAREASAAAGRPIDVLVNVVGGIVGRKTMLEMDDNFWDCVFALNVKSVFAMVQGALPLFKDGGAIINVSSQAGRDGGGPGAIAYSSSKGAVMSMTRGLAKELGPRRIRVNALCPGMISTRFHDEFTKPEARQRTASMTPLGREGKPNEVGDLITYLTGPRSTYVNGACIDINGGLVFS